MTAIRLRAKHPPYVQLPQCCVPVADSPKWATWYIARRTTRLNKLGWDVERCTRGGTVEIDGKPYCGQHAGQLALAKLLGEEPDFT